MTLGPQFHKIFRYEPMPNPSQSVETATTRIDTHPSTEYRDYYEYRPTQGKTGARLEVSHDTGSSRYEYPLEGHESAWASQVEPDEQIPLFKASFTPPSSKVDYVHGTRAARVASTTMMGIAEIETNIKYGRSLVSGDSLSAHSRKLIAHLRGAGVKGMPQNMRNTKRNKLDFWPTEYDTWEEHTDVIPESTVTAGRSRVRSILRQGKIGKEKAPRQRKLPGMGRL